MLSSIQTACSDSMLLDGEPELQVNTYNYQSLCDQAHYFDSLKDPKGFLRGGVRNWSKELTNNPCTKPSDPAISLATYGNRVIGRLGYIPGNVQIRGKTHRVLGLDGFFVDEEFRSTGAGGALILAALGTRFGLVASGAPSDAAQHLYTKAGFQELGPLRRFIFFNRTRPIIEYVLGCGRLSDLASKCTQPIASLLGHLAVQLGRFTAPSETINRSAKDTWNDLERSNTSTNMSANSFPISDDQWAWARSQNELQRIELHVNGAVQGHVTLGISSIMLPSRNKQNITMTAAKVLDYQLAKDCSRLKRAVLANVIDFVRQNRLDVLEFQLSDVSLANLCKYYGMQEKGGNKMFFRPSRRLDLNSDDVWELRFASGDVLIHH